MTCIVASASYGNTILKSRLLPLLLFLLVWLLHSQTVVEYFETHVYEIPKVSFNLCGTDIV